MKNYLSSSTINLKGYVAKDAPGNRFMFPSSHYLQPRRLHQAPRRPGTDSDTKNVVYRDNCNFLWNNDKDTIYLYKPSGNRPDVHSYSRGANDRDGKRIHQLPQLR
ncbi:lamin tail domain-containing protein [Streptomyces coeruleorubidus]|uniref:lamin tail domain-containing protein n=1 Tax=Streptomyces coeruleorubidus TaxID=116188 RepID=UPI001E2880C3|nr:lamin tail domain-containing protein [Streptomyces coeruleorubidus]